MLASSAEVERNDCHSFADVAQMDEGEEEEGVQDRPLWYST